MIVFKRDEIDPSSIVFSEMKRCQNPQFTQNAKKTEACRGCRAGWLTYYRAPTPWVSQQTTLPVRSHTAESHRSYHLQNLDAAQPRQKDAHRKLSFAKNNAFWENPEKNWLQFSKNQAKF